MTTVPTSPKPALNTIARRGLIATLIAVVINVVLFLAGSLFTFPPEAVTAMGGPIEIRVVAAMTFGAGVFAIIGYLVLTRFLDLETADRVTAIVTILALILMGINPFVSIENAPLAEIIILEIMHVVAALPAIAFVRGLF